MDLSALIQAAADTLRGAPVPEDGRVRDVPDERTVRYYQSAGLVDRPSGYAGRSAVYGERHLLQLLCIKLLQARGLSIAQIQRALAGATDAQLRAAVADGLGATPAQADGVAIGTPAGSPPAPPQNSSGTAAQVAVEIAPGVLVIVDPRRVPDPAEVLHRLTLALNGARS
jgi:DNA-binding transcriptional MerR regulator